MITHYIMIKESNQQQYGYTHSQREEYISQCLRINDSSLPKFPLNFRGKTEPRPIIEVPIGFPIYRIENGRTQTLQEEYIKINSLPSTFFSADHGSPETQKAQHELLQKLTKKSDLYAEFKNPKLHQIDEHPILCTIDGIIINGNRRVSTWRDLYYNEPEKYSHFENIRIVILPYCTPQDIEKLESDLQIKKDLKSEYLWHARSQLLKNKRNQGSTDAQIAKIFGMSEKDVNIYIEMFELARKYLIDNGHEAEWSLVDDAEHTFYPIVEGKNKFKKISEKESFEGLALSYLKLPKNSSVTVSGRLFTKIPYVVKYHKEIKTEIRKQFGEELRKKEEKQIPLSDSIHDILAGNASTNNEAIADRVLNEFIRENPEKVVPILEDTIKIRRSIEIEGKEQTYVLLQLQKMNKLVTLSKDKIQEEGYDLSKAGVLKEIESIESQLKTIKSWAIDEN